MLRPLLTAAALALVSGTASAQSLTTEPVASGLDRPVFVTAAPGVDSRLYVIEQEGAIRVIESGTLLPTPFMDIDPLVAGGTSGGDERGLLGLAFPPDFLGTLKFYVYYYRSAAGGGFETVVVEYQATDLETADLSSAREIITFSQPFGNHNGGWIDFGPNDGYLYIAVGDGGSGDDPSNNASRLDRDLGKIHRIDVSDDSVPYTVPSTNPFVGTAGALPEIWAYGLRNPWRTSFDVATGDLWIGDVGQLRREEVNYQPASSPGGEHYGWRCREGDIANPAFSVPATCPADDPLWVEPVHAYDSTQSACSVVGGYVYRGCALGEEFQGKYIFGDYCTGQVWTLDPDNGFARTQHGVYGFGLASFGQGADDEIYVTDIDAGTVSRLVNPAIGDRDNDSIPDSCDCLADLNNEGVLNNFDINQFINLFINESPIVDFNDDGAWNNADINIFIAAFIAGC